jgi:hypothetical protein
LRPTQACFLKGAPVSRAASLWAMDFTKMGFGLHRAATCEVFDGFYVCCVRVSLCIYVVEGCGADENHPLGHSAVAFLAASEQARTKKEGFPAKFSALRALHQCMLPQVWQK